MNHHIRHRHVAGQRITRVAQQAQLDGEADVYRQTRTNAGFAANWINSAGLGLEPHSQKNSSRSKRGNLNTFNQTTPRTQTTPKNPKPRKPKKPNFKNQGSKAKALANTRHVETTRVAVRTESAVDQADEVVTAGATGRRRPGEGQRPPLTVHRPRTIQGTQFWLRRQPPAGLAIDGARTECACSGRSVN